MTVRIHTRYKIVTRTLYGPHGTVWEWMNNLTPHFIMEVITFANVRRFSVCQRIPTVWATSEGRPRNLLDGWLTLFERTSDVPQRASSHAGRRKKICECSKSFRSLASENESGRVRTLAKHVQHSQSMNESCVFNLAILQSDVSFCTYILYIGITTLYSDD